MEINKKGESLTITQIILLIIGVVVLIVVLAFIVKPELWHWVIDLPSYTYNDTDKVLDLSEMSKEAADLLGCGERIGFIGDKPTGALSKLGWRDIRVLYMYEFNEKTKKYDSRKVRKKDETWNGLFVDVDRKGKNRDKYVIKIVDRGDINVGEINLVGDEKVLKIYEELIDNYNSNNKLREHVSLDDLIRLNGAKLVTETGLCKSKGEVEKIVKDVTILGKDAQVVLDKGTDRCTLKLDTGTYGLNNNKLEYFDKGAWKDIDLNVANSLQVMYKNIKDSLVDTEKNRIKLNFEGEEYEVRLIHLGLVSEILDGKKYYYRPPNIIGTIAFEEKNDKMSLRQLIPDDFALLRGEEEERYEVMRDSFRNSVRNTKVNFAGQEMGLELIDKGSFVVLYINVGTEDYGVIRNVNEVSYKGYGDLTLYRKTEDGNWENFEGNLATEELYLNREIKQELVNSCKQK